MITIEALKMGLARYLDQEFVCKVSGLRKWALAIGGSALINQYVDNNIGIGKTLGFITADGMVDIDNAYKVCKEAVERAGSVTQNIMGTDVTFSVHDIDTIYSLCRS